MTRATFRPPAAEAAVCTQSLPCAPESASEARRLVSAALNTWQLSPLNERAALVVTELVANVVEHTHSRAVRVTITRIGPSSVLLGVVDMDCREPHVLTAGPDDEQGRGLALIEAFADRWGVDQLPGGKRTWAELGEDPP